MTLPGLLLAAQWFFLGYLVLLNLAYLALDVVAFFVMEREVEASAGRLLPAAFSGLEPPITLVVPAYNEEATIAASLWSLLQLEYPGFEIVVVNDGSRDRTLEVLVAEFGLRPFPEAYHAVLPSRPVRGLYRAERFPALRVIDKENGGKADALNAGINAARCPLVCVVDADSVLQRDSLQKIVRPLMEDPRVVAVGGTIRLANGCRVSEGFMDQVGLPKGWLARIQVVEYLRAFLFGRLGWSPMNGLLIISGAFGLFRKEAVVEAGGYRTATVGEDMELVVRLHRLRRVEGRRRPHRIVYVPDPICWTEAPESLRVLRSQRMRWQRGLLESLAANRQLLFHPRGGAAGWLAFPLMLLFEGLGPLVELAGWLLLVVAVLSGGLSWMAFGAWLLAALGMSVLLSVSALLLEELSFHLYEEPRQLFTLLGAILLENLGYRQLNAWWRLQATFLWLARRPGRWGAMQRTATWQSGPGKPG